MAQETDQAPWLPLECVLIDAELETRASRAPDYAAENRVLVSLANELAKPRSDVLRLLAGAALELCRAGSAGVSLLELEGGRAVFRWHAIVGALSELEGGSIPRDASPCGVVIRSHRPLLMKRPERHFRTLLGLEPRVHEVLLIPFTMLGQDVGTVWIVSHESARGFDAEDRRLMTSLAGFASAAFTLRASMQSVLDAAADLSQANQRLKKIHRRNS